MLTICGLGLASLTQAQTPTWQNDTIHMEEGYAKNVYYSLNTGTVKTSANNIWDLAFRSDLMSVGVYANHAGAQVTVYPLTGLSAAAHFGTDLTNDTAGFTLSNLALYNSISTWDTGALNQDRDLGDQLDLGWGYYEPTTHLISGDKIYLIQTPTADYQLWIESDDPFTAANPPLWTIHIANLDGSNRKDITHNSNPTYTNKLMAYYNIANNEFLDLDPLKNDWDFIFTRYTELVSQGPVSMMYPVTGILSNLNRPSMELRGQDAVDAVWNSAMATSMMDKVDNIGRDWKKQTQTVGVYDLDTVSYFMKDAQSNIWQFEFTYATVGSAASGVTPGEIALRKRKVQSTASVQDVNNKLNQAVIVPNPAHGTATLVLDTKDFVGQSSIAITDISGRILMQKNQTLQKGLQQIKLDVQQYPAGMYFVNIIADGYKTTCKLIVK